jgi:hypothetical protein
MIVLVCVNTSKQVSDAEHLKNVRKCRRRKDVVGGK